MFDLVSEAAELFGGGAVPGTADAKVDRIAAWERVIAHAHARQALVIADFASQRACEDRAAGVTSAEAGKYAAEEVALARRVSPAAAGHQIEFARGLVEHHPATLEALLRGAISMPAARTVVAECELLDAVARRAVDADIALEAPELTAGQVRVAVRRRVIEADAEAAAKRARKARSRKRISLLPADDGVAGLLASLPAEQAVACWVALDHHARGVRGDGDDRSIDSIMCDTLVERITGQRRATDVRVEVGIVISAGSLLGADETPATLGGYGAISAELARELADSKFAWARRLVCDPLDGQVVAVGSRRRRFIGGRRRFIVARDQVCRLPVCDARIRDADHRIPYAHGGTTDVENGQGLCERTHYCRDHPGWRLEAEPESDSVTWITPTGHRYESHPPPALGHGSLDSETLRELRRRRGRYRKRRRKPR